MTSSTPAVQYDSLMIDIEALGKRPHGAIVSIGAFLFNQDGADEPVSPAIDAPDRCFHAVVNLQDALDHGFKIDADTLQWFLKQSNQAWSVLLEKGKPIESVLHAIARFYEPQRRERSTLPRVWGYPSHYDCVLVEDLFRASSIACPWDTHRAPRDVRTLLDTVESITGWSDKRLKALKPQVGTLHNALDDAKGQAIWVQRLRRTLRAGIPSSKE
jgi:hypothetical protein